MNDINATIGLGNLLHIKPILEKFRKNALIYHSKLNNLKNIQLLNVDIEKSANWIYTIKINKFKQDFIDFMKDNGIMTSQVHARNDTHSCLKEYQCELPQLNKLEKQIVCIPVGWWLSDTEISYIINKIIEWDANTCMSLNIIPLNEKYKDDYINLVSELYRIKRDVNNFNEVLKTNRVFLLLKNDKCIGTFCVFLEKKLYDNVLKIEDVIVKQEYRGNGCGKFILDFIDANMYDNYKKVLNCSKENVSFYEKCGYVNEGYQMVKRETVLKSSRSDDDSAEPLKNKTYKPKINLIIASYSGNIANRVKFDKNCKCILQLNLTCLKKIKDDNFDIMVICPPNNDKNEYNSYYKKDLWPDVKFVDYYGENQHYSYDQWIQGYLHNKTYDYYILIEDDYTLLVNPVELVKNYKSILNNNIGYVCSYASEHAGFSYHASISNGVISKQTFELMEKCDGNILNKYYTYTLNQQFSFSLLFLDMNISIKDFIEYYYAPFYHSGEHIIINYGDKSKPISFIPIQMIYSDITLQAILND
jgi:predicted GNAT family N-acyltransferase